MSEKSKQKKHIAQIEEVIPDAGKDPEIVEAAETLERAEAIASLKGSRGGDALEAIALDNAVGNMRVLRSLAVQPNVTREELLQQLLAYLANVEVLETLRGAAKDVPELQKELDTLVINKQTGL